MGTILQILGIIFLLVVVLGYLAVWSIRRKLMGFAKAMGEIVAPATPPKVTLTEVVNPDWESSEKVSKYVHEFQSLGFLKGGAYLVNELPGTKIYALFHSNSSCGLVYDQPQAGVWIDIVGKYLDDTSSTFTNAPMGHQMDHMPGQEKHYDQNASIEQLFELFKQSHTGKRAKEISHLTFKSEFESSYSKEMAWRNSRGGPTSDEIRRVSAGEFSEETMMLAQKALGRQASDAIEQELFSNFVNSSSQPHEYWAKRRDELVFVHEGSDVEDLFCNVADWTDHEVEPKVGESPRAYMRRLNASLDPSDQYDRVAELREPVAADVYLAPTELR